MIYLDSAAIVKLLRVEHESPDLVAWLEARADTQVVTSALAEVEVSRALRRSSPEALIAVPNVMARLYHIDIDSTIRATAAAYQNPMLHSLDAIHLATAQVHGLNSRSPLTAFVTYDKRLLEAAGEIGIPTASPGVVD